MKFRFGLALAAVLGSGGCATTPDQPGFPSRHRPDAPRGYEPLQARHAGFVEAVHFCDFYNARQIDGAGGWARVLTWSERKNDATTKGGRAVAIYALKNKLWVYDLDHGFQPLATPFARRMDLAALAPEILARYPAADTTPLRYLDERPQPPDQAGADYAAGATTEDLNEAMHVAAALGKYRPVRVVEFIAPRDSYLRPYAAVVFKYGGALCLYSPASGTRVAEASPAAAIDDLGLVQAFVREAFPDAQDVKWFQPARPVVVR